MENNNYVIIVLKEDVKIKTTFLIINLFSTGALPLLFIAFCEIMVTAWGYGTRR